MMRPTRRLLLPLLLLVPLGWGRPPVVHGAPAVAPSLASRLARRIAAANARPGTLGVVVVALGEDRRLAERDADVPLVPASVAKVATAVAALDLLGPGYEFVTALEARGRLDAATGTLEGDLVLRGSGDPGLSPRDADAGPGGSFARLAQGAAAAGIRRVTGAVVLDDGPFDRAYVHPTWAASDLDKDYAAPLAGLSWNDGCVTAVVRGGAAVGAAGRVTLPATSGPWPLEAAVSTWDEDRTQVGGFWAPGPRLRVAGGLPVGAEYTLDAPVPDPLAFVGGAFGAALSAQGVEVGGRWRVARDGADRAPGRPLAEVRHGLASTLRVMNKRSQNLWAALLFKACGVEHAGRGTWVDGEAAVSAAMARRGVAATGQRVVDGSGLSKANRLSAGAIARLLVSLEADPLRGPLLRDSLAVPGEEGTLRKRLREGRGRVRAKTGTLGRSGIHALAGYVDGASGASGYAFVVLCNDPKVDGRDLGDDLVRALLDG